MSTRLGILRLNFRCHVDLCFGRVSSVSSQAPILLPRTVRQANRFVGCLARPRESCAQLLHASQPPRCSRVSPAKSSPGPAKSSRVKASQAKSRQIKSSQATSKSLQSQVLPQLPQPPHCQPESIARARRLKHLLQVRILLPNQCPDRERQSLGPPARWVDLLRVGHIWLRVVCGLSSWLRSRRCGLLP